MVWGPICKFNKKWTWVCRGRVVFTQSDHVENILISETISKLIKKSQTDSSVIFDAVCRDIITSLGNLVYNYIVTYFLLISFSVAEVRVSVMMFWTVARSLDTLPICSSRFFHFFHFLFHYVSKTDLICLYWTVHVVDIVTQLLDL